jgi:thiol-disulfide isomerase/thioredoxin
MARITNTLLLLLLLVLPVRAQDDDSDFSDQSNPMVGFKVVYFTADWCAPCQRFKPVIARLHKEGLPLLMNPIDNDTRFSTYMKVKMLPTLLFLNEGVEVGRIEGVKEYAEIIKLYESLRMKYPPQPIPDNFPDTPSDIPEDHSGLPCDDLEYRFLFNPRRS